MKRESGYRAMWTPYAELTWLDSGCVQLETADATVESALPAEKAYLASRWGRCSSATRTITRISAWIRWEADWRCPTAHPSVGTCPANQRRGELRAADEGRMNEVVVVLSSYNGARYISEQIRSICGQTFADWTLLVRDDGSTDDTLRVVEELSRVILASSS